MTSWSVNVLKRLEIAFHAENRTQGAWPLASENDLCAKLLKHYYISSTGTRLGGARTTVGLGNPIFWVDESNSLHLPWSGLELGRALLASCHRERLYLFIATIMLNAGTLPTRPCVN